MYKMYSCINEELTVNFLFKTFVNVSKDKNCRFSRNKKVTNNLDFYYYY